MKLNIITQRNEEQSICSDTGYSASRANRQCISDQYSGLEVRKRAARLRLRGLRSTIHESHDYVLLAFSFPDHKLSDGEPAIATLVREVEIIKNMQAKYVNGERL